MAKDKYVEVLTDSEAERVDYGENPLQSIPPEDKVMLHFSTTSYSHNERDFVTHSTLGIPQYQIVWLIFLLQGIGLLLPFNVYITASVYWNDLWVNFATFFEFLLVLAYNYPGIFALWFNIQYVCQRPISAREI